MKALVLAAGSGKRMRPLTRNTHKALLPIGGRTVLQRIIDSLLENGVGDVTVVTGYRAAEVRGHLAESFPNVDFDYVHNARFAETNNIHSVALALDTMKIDISTSIRLRPQRGWPLRATPLRPGPCQRSSSAAAHARRTAP